MSLSVLWKFFLLFHVVYGFISVPTNKHPIHSCRQLSQALDKDRCYCEKPFHFLSLDDLVFYYGDRNSWWGDLNAKQTRTLYHQLLPIYYPYYLTDYSIQTLSIKAFQTRKAVKQYARRHAYFHVRCLSILIDIFHNLWEYRRWGSATYDELWQKYKYQFQEQNHLEASDDQIASTIVMKSCCTNEWIDFLCS